MAILQIEDDLAVRAAASAAATGISVDRYAADAVRKKLEHEAWFSSEVLKGIEAADRGAVVSWSEMKRQLEETRAGRRQRTGAA